MYDQIIRKILSSRVYEVIRESPLDRAPKLSARTGHQVRFKREDLLPVFSFKLRGAYEKAARLDASERARGLIASSAGNHAQGVAFAAKELGTKAVIFMPQTTPTIKVDAVRALGADVRLEGDSLDEAFAAARIHEKESGMVFIHPFDDLDVIAGQGTIGMELMRQTQGNIHAVFVPVGGGGLLAGVSLYLKFVQPEIRLIGVEPNDAASMKAAFDAGKPVPLESVGLFADGAAVREVGQESFRICREHVDELLQVDTDEVCAAIKDAFEDTRSILEPAGALGVAGLKKWCTSSQESGRELVALTCGANMNFDRLRHVSERAELGEGREAIFCVTIPERPRAMRELCEAIGKHNITEFNYRYSSSVEAKIFLGIQLQTPESRANLADRIRSGGFAVTDLSHNETAKLHIRHMVGGGHRPEGPEEIYRFEFPERPGALMSFLQGMPGSWNISLFHYRNHGAAFGRVLAGIQIPPSERPAFESYISDLGYHWQHESNNPAIQEFLEHSGTS